MPHVSNRKLEDKHRHALYKELVKSLERCFDVEKGWEVMSEFFTHTEREMFTKRFAVIALLDQKVPIMKISHALKMSPVTIETMSVKYEAGKYDLILKHALGKKDIWEILDHILTAGGIIPHKAGKDRWKKFNKDFRKQKLQKS